MLNVVLVAVATLLGVFLRYFEAPFTILIGLGGLGIFVWLVICEIAAGLVKPRPHLATILFQFWYAVPLILIVFTTYFAT